MQHYYAMCLFVISASSASTVVFLSQVLALLRLKVPEETNPSSGQSAPVYTRKMQTKSEMEC